MPQPLVRPHYKLKERRFLLILFLIIRKDQLEKGTHEATINSTMRSIRAFAVLFLAGAAVVASASTSSSVEARNKIDNNKDVVLGNDVVTAASPSAADIRVSGRKLQDADPWPKDTKVLYKDPTDGKVYTGSISHYNNEGGEWHYTINWDDGEVEDEFNFDEVNDMVSAAETAGSSSSSAAAAAGDKDPWPQGTKVQYVDPKDGTVYTGSISHYNNNGGWHYVIDWDDGEVENEFNFEEVNDMVAAAEAADSSSTTSASDGGDDEPWPKGTKVLDNDDDGKVYSGTIVQYNNDGGWHYEIKWDNGETSNEFDFDQVSKWVAAAKASAAEGNDKYIPWPQGTLVLEKDPEDGKWYAGTIRHFNNDDGKWHYVIKWDNGETSSEYELEEVGEWVAAANQAGLKTPDQVASNRDVDPLFAASSASGGNNETEPIIILTVVVIVLASVSILAFFIRKKLRAVRKEVIASSNYRDDPAEKEIPDVV